jgi:hypothetical protein
MSVVVWAKIKFIYSIIILSYKWVTYDKYKGVKDKILAADQYMLENLNEGYVLNRYEGRYQLRHEIGKPLSNNLKLDPVNMISYYLRYNRGDKNGMNIPYLESIYLGMLRNFMA